LARVWFGLTVLFLADAFGAARVDRWLGGRFVRAA
jgi:hypothetical protein